jgi:hypothetical protein
MNRDWMEELSNETYRIATEQAYKQMIQIIRKSKIRKIFKNGN